MIEKCWRHQSSSYTPSRILGLYPLAAMINHSCSPNAVRIFAAGNIMVVHASMNVPQGTEIVWSYLPPTNPYPIRQERLSLQYGFCCRCHRCLGEQLYWSNDCHIPTLDELVELCKCSTVERAPREEEICLKQWSTAVHSLEDKLLVDPALRNEIRHYLRVGFCHVYVNYLNDALQEGDFKDEHLIEALLNICTKLHLAFCGCDNASTEHLSVRL